ncbi:glyoxalase/bleomycin resistance/extradiol dioxygenase family protein [Streptomyces sp. JHA26]|uniref:VOC family protein n=1 Tax=Streptomyces sp. JHA26 TaxID=1917143 RepID=UPI000989ADBA|nr:hypothetical protein [Streptomyces sp. JHA26]
MHIRAVRLDELPVLQDTERAAGQCFRDIGMPEIAADEPLPLGELVCYHHAGLAWVAANAADVPVAYLIADRVDGNLHVEQVSVHPAGAEILQPPTDMFHGDRTVILKDPSGHNWVFLTHVEDVSEEELRRRPAAAG